MLTAAIVIALDQITKWLVVRYFVAAEGGNRAEIVAPWLALVYVENRGAAFGILQGHSDLLLILAVVLVIGITVVFQRTAGRSPLMPIATGLVIGGALGNIIDRVRLGFVIDFVAVGPWPKFNVADSAVSIGVVLLIGATLFGKGPSGPSPSAAADGLRHVSDR